MGVSRYVPSILYLTDYPNMTNIYDSYPNVDWLKERNFKRSTSIPTDLIVTLPEGRRNKQVYPIFFDRFLSSVVKKSVFEHQVRVATNDSTLCTVSDEAFALLLLENSWDRWLDIYRRQKGKVTPKRGQKRREFESDVPTKYTKGRTN